MKCKETCQLGHETLLNMNGNAITETCHLILILLIFNAISTLLSPLYVYWRTNNSDMRDEKVACR